MTIEIMERDPALVYPAMVPVWTHILIHHTASSIYKSVEQLRREHMNLGYVDVAYNYLPDYRGNVHAGRPLNIPGAHARGWNTRGIGIACIGDFDVLSMGTVQQGALIELIRKLMRDHHIPAENILYHKDVTATLCPGRNFFDAKGVITVPFKDVPHDHWAAGVVKQAKEAGILGGYSDGTFRGESPATRYEVAAVIAKIMERLGN